MIYFTSDLHLFHKNVLKFDNRPFKSVEDMHLEIIKRWNNKDEKLQGKKKLYLLLKVRYYI